MYRESKISINHYGTRKRLVALDLERLHSTAPQNSRSLALSVCNIFFKTSFSTTLSRLGLKSTITDGANGITILRSA